MKRARMKWRRGQGRGKYDINMLIFIENCVWSGCSNRVVHITALLWQMTVPKTIH